MFKWRVRNTNPNLQEARMSATQMKSNVLVLTKDSEQQAKLRRKHGEYAKRYEFVAPEPHPSGTYRLRLLGVLLEKQVGDVDEVADGCRTQFGWHFEAEFNEAVAIITAYNPGDLAGIRPNSGTGLR